MCYLTVGNLFIGGLEAWVLNRVTKGRLPRFVEARCIGANYLSAFAGGAALVAAINAMPLAHRAVIDHPRLLLWSSLAASFVVSVLMEWPVLRWRAGRPMLWPVIVANVASYLLLVPLFAWLPINNVGDWQFAPFGDRPHADGYRLAFASRSGAPQVVDLGTFDAAGPTKDLTVHVDGEVRVIEGWDMGSHGFGYIYFRPPTHRSSEWLMVESPFVSNWPKDMATVDGRYLACTLGPYVLVVDPERKTIYRIAEGTDLHVFLNRSAASPESRPTPTPPATTSRPAR